MFTIVTLELNQTGWIEINMKRAIYMWRNAGLQQAAMGRVPMMVGTVMIEVNDDEGRPLKPGTFFKAPHCGDEAGMCVVSQACLF